ncbi:integrating conjugative element protein [Pseudomonas sp. RW407]|uniref:integrating conjugative element protein n=1 Tax=Pseudomonas sp. RW407 TaxID=2202894 RepID=UPI000D6EBAD4|nr:integrating conjugative element protein [Pseudomonas sp. RW407]PWU28654.1 integrating conjugative element protein [Pseudomonas sp. RW407]
MTHPLNRCLALLIRNATLSLLLPFAQASADQLVVVEDHGGVSALPYYQDLVPDSTDAQRPPVGGVRMGGAFPVVTPELSPGPVQGRVINAPGLQPLFLLGDDDSSRSWLQQHLQQLLQLQAVGLVVNVSGPGRLAEVRKWAPGLQMLPTPGTDIAGRLGLRHYPVLITSTTVQQ